VTIRERPRRSALLRERLSERCRRLRAAGAVDVANGIVVVSGPLPVDELNKCLWISGYCRRMFTRLASLPHGKLQGHNNQWKKAA